MTASLDPAIDHLIQTFQTLTLESVAMLDRVYAADARFKDPFNDVQGLSAIQRIFRHMFASLDQPRFLITGRIVQGQQCFLTWEFHFGFKRFKQRQAQCIVGASHLLLDEAGLITLHRDYWDAAEELYEKLPLVGGLMRWLKARANA